MFSCLLTHKLLARANLALLLAQKGCGGSSLSPPPHASSGLLAFLKRKYKELEVHRDRTLDRLEAMNKTERQHIFSDSHETEGLNEEGNSQRRDNGGFMSFLKGAQRTSESPLPCPRSVLLVSCSSSRALKKIRDSTADCFILDLEDSVTPSMKREIRDRVRDFVQEIERERLDGVCAGKRLVVRISSPEFDTAAAMLDLELAGLLGTSIEGVAVPKVTTKTYDLIQSYVHPDHKIWAFFEHPISVLQAPAICLSGKYSFAVIGCNTLSAELHLPSKIVSGRSSVSAIPLDSFEGWQASPLLHATHQVLFSARAANMFVIDGVYNDPTDKMGFKQDLSRCQALGFDGKCVIHSDQIAPTHESFTPNCDEVEWAIHIREEIARASGGISALDGTAIEGLHARRADRVLQLYRMAAKEKRDSEVAASTGAGVSSQPKEELKSATNGCTDAPGKKSRRGKPTDDGRFS
ncbi:unnamed protein product [Phytomonas sp. EM1]|nr:unnamed protein product [Phytomonas sp. EM1]|eukprot:CCW62585.1 unnamed protein product [Phytomonas sp. isolate EM1]